MKLFIRDGNKIKVAFDELYLYPAFEKLLNVYGKDDNVLEKIIRYIYFTCDPKAVPQQKGYNTKESHKYAIKNSNLSEKFEVGKEVKDAQAFYKKESSNAMIEYIETIVKSLRVGNKACKFIMENQEIEEGMTKETLSSVIDSVNSVLGLSSKINTAIPSLIQNIKDLKQSELEEKEDGDTLRGGAETIPDSYDGNNEIEEDA